MKAIGVKALKARLSEYLREVKAGETILVTERDTVIAELRPTRRQLPAPSSLEQWLHELAERGEATLRSTDRLVWEHDRDRPPPAGISSQEILDALRED